MVLNPAALENQGTDAFKSGSSLSIPGVRDCVTKELLMKIEAQLPNVAVSSLGLRALRDRLTIQISEARELRSRFPDTFLYGRVSAVLTAPCAPAETTAKP